MSEQKPIKIWVQSKDLDFDLNWEKVIRGELPDKDCMDGPESFIAKSEYDALAARLAECEAALGFYADPLGWYKHIDESVPKGHCVPRGGKIARKYFERWGGK